MCIVRNHSDLHYLSIKGALKTAEPRVLLPMSRKVVFGHGDKGVETRGRVQLLSICVLAVLPCAGYSHGVILILW